MNEVPLISLIIMASTGFSLGWFGHWLACRNDRYSRKNWASLVNDALDIIYWMSGSVDFSPEGTAHKGWLKAQPRIKVLQAAADNEDV